MNTKDLTSQGYGYWAVDRFAGPGVAVWGPGSCSDGTGWEYFLVLGFTWGAELPADQVIVTPKEHSKIGHTYLL